MKLTGKGRLGLLAVLLLAIGGTYAVWDRAQGAPVVNQQPLTESQFFPINRVQFTPAAANAKISLTAVDAVKAYLDDPMPPGLDKSSGPPVVSLVVYTSETGDTAGMAPTLVWLVKFNDVPEVAFGPDVGKSERANSSFKCPFYVVIDATSGKRLRSFQTCDAPSKGQKLRTDSSR